MLSFSGCGWAWVLVDNRVVPTATCFIAFTTANAISLGSSRPPVSFSTTSLMNSQPKRRVRMHGRLNAPKRRAMAWGRTRFGTVPWEAAVLGRHAEQLRDAISDPHQPVEGGVP